MTLQLWDPDRGTVAWLQGQLSSMGFDPGPVDGVYGPQTASAVSAYQSAHGLPPSGIYDAGTEAALTSAQPAAAAAASTTGQSAQDMIRTVYPQVAWAYDIPEVRAVIDAAAAGSWDQARIQGAIEATQWWKTTTATARQWSQLNAEDPATAESQRQARHAEVTALAGQLGIPISADYIAHFTDYSLRMGLGSQSQLTSLLLSFAGAQTPIAGQLSSTKDQLRNTASQYAVPVSEGTLGTWAGQILGGSATQEGWLSYLTDQAKLMFPALAPNIDAGQTVRQVVEPYFQIAQRELGVNPSQMNLLDQKWSRPINQIDPATSQATLMNQNQWVATLRTDPAYGYDTTQNGQTAAVDLTTQIQKMFGSLG